MSNKDKSWSEMDKLFEDGLKVGKKAFKDKIVEELTKQIEKATSSNTKAILRLIRKHINKLKV